MTLGIIGYIVVLLILAVVVYKTIQTKSKNKIEALEKKQKCF